MREVFCAQSWSKIVLTWKNFELPQYEFTWKRTERFRTNLVREVFCAQFWSKIVRTWKNFELPQYEFTWKRTERFRTNLVREVFCAQSRSKIARTWKNFCCLYIATQEFTWKKKWIFNQSAAPTLATLASGAWACWDKRIGIKIYIYIHLKIKELAKTYFLK